MVYLISSALICSRHFSEDVLRFGGLYVIASCMVSTVHTRRFEPYTACGVVSMRG